MGLVATEQIINDPSIAVIDSPDYAHFPQLSERLLAEGFSIQFRVTGDTAIFLPDYIVMTAASAAISATPTGCTSGTVAFHCDTTNNKIGYWSYDDNAYESVGVT